MFEDSLRQQIDFFECEPTNEVVNGFFYILEYKATHEVSIKEGYDRNPVIYCFMPDERNINCFWGINFHCFNQPEQHLIFTKMLKYYNIMEHNNKRVVLSGEQLNRIYTNIGIGLRCYSRKNVRAAYKIHNYYIPKYLNFEPDFYIKNKELINIDFKLAPGNKGF